MNLFHSKLFALIVFEAAAICSVSAQTAEKLSVQNVRFTPDTRISAVAAASPVMDAELFAQTALIASGASADEISTLTVRLHAVASSVISRIPSDASEEEKADLSLHLLYEELLSIYSEQQTRLDAALVNGSYNCVSSAVLFMYLMKKQNIPVTAVETPLHAFCTVTAAGREIDVETTNPWGFEPGKKKQAATNSAATKKYVTVPANKYANRHAVDDRRIIALIYNNRMAALQKQKRDPEAVGLASDALYLQNGSAPSVETFCLAVYNTAVSYTSQNDDESGLELIDDARALHGDSPFYQKYEQAAVGNLMNSAMRQNDYDRAITYLAANKFRLPESEFRTMYEGVVTNDIVYAVKAEPFASVCTRLAAQRSNISDTKYAELLSFAYSNEADRIARTGAWLEAASFLEKGIAENPGSTALTKQRSVYRQNYAAAVHNRAAQLYNAGDKDGARSVIEEGLLKVDDSALLKNDLHRMAD